MLRRVGSGEGGMCHLNCKVNLKYESLERAYWVDWLGLGYSNLICQWRLFLIDEYTYPLQALVAAEHPVPDNAVYEVIP